jgi:hypothetical protein
MIWSLILLETQMPMQKKSIANQLSIDKSYKIYCLVKKEYGWDFHPPSNAVGLDLIS